MAYNYWHEFIKRITRIKQGLPLIYNKIAEMYQRAFAPLLNAIHFKLLYILRLEHVSFPLKYGPEVFKTFLQIQMVSVKTLCFCALSTSVLVWKNVRLTVIVKV